MPTHQEFITTINTLFPDAQAALHSGSHAYGTASPTSDVDLVLITEATLPQAYQYITFKYQGLVYEVFIFSAANLTSTIEQQAAERNNA